MNINLQLNPSSIPIAGPPTPSSIFDKDPSNPLEDHFHTLHLDDTHSSHEENNFTPSKADPIKVAFLPNKGRCYLAARTIQPQERIFVAESYGTTMCDPWLDCGVCHDCWGRIPDRKAQIRLPRKPLPGMASAIGTKKSLRSKKTESTVMVFCNETCWNRYGPVKADLICQVEEKIRRSWEIKHAAGPNGHWRVQTTIQTPLTLVAGAGSATAILSSEASAPATHYSTLIPQALAVASTPMALSKLQDQDLTLFLNCVWNALDSLVAEQESFIGTLQQQQQHERLEIASGVLDKRAEALYPMLAKFLLEGNCKATIGSKTADDDCETIRLLTDILYRRQGGMDQEVAVHHTQASTDVGSEKDGLGLRGVQPDFADLCSMQSNELVLFRQQLQQDADERTGEENKADTDIKDSKQDRTGPWRELLSILPNHLLSCFYVYLRIRDAYLLLDIESAWGSAPRLSIDSALFRNILYREVANSFGIRDNSDELLAFAIFPRASYFNHSCRPNVEKRRVGRHFEYWSTVAIGENEECCISYGDINPGRIERQTRLEDMYFFHCNCPRCVEEEAKEKQ